MIEFTPPEMVDVTVNRNGAEISATVAWEHAPAVLKALLDVFRQTTAEYPELTQELQHLGGSSTTYDGYWWNTDRAKPGIGFTG